MLIRPPRLFFLGSLASIAAVFIGIFRRYVRAAPPRDHLLIMRSCFHRFVTRAVWTKEWHKPVKTEDIMNAVELLGPALLEFLPTASTIENSSCAGAFLLAGLRKGVMSPWGIVFRSGESRGATDVWGWLSILPIHFQCFSFPRFGEKRRLFLQFAVMLSGLARLSEATVANWG